ncbi:MAG: hypothetical protein K8U03_26860 [Planctomycetia bacterium]|nr:hypothetical protein [Planctomycetia bacterium]
MTKVENPASYRNLRPSEIVETIDVLRRRIQERFPASGLYQVACELHRISEESVIRAQRIRRPNIGLRFGILLIAVLVAWLIWQGAKFIRMNDEVFQLEHFVQSVEASLGSAVFIGAAIVFLFSLELRMKRARALDAVRELRSLAHIIDMHQLTKDPERITRKGSRTASSPKRSMTPFELGRYLDYCSELLSLTSKTGALYVQEFPDEVAIEAVDRLTNLTTDLSRNIWQKIMILETTVPDIAANSKSKAQEAGSSDDQPSADEASIEIDDAITAAPLHRHAQID